MHTHTYTHDAMWCDVLIISVALSIKTIVEIIILRTRNGNGLNCEWWMKSSGLKNGKILSCINLEKLNRHTRQFFWSSFLDKKKYL